MSSAIVWTIRPTLDERAFERPPRETPKHVADKLRQSKSAVEGERKQVTVLFADVKDSMELAESLDPEALRLYTEVGAPLQAARLQREIGS